MLSSLCLIKPLWLCVKSLFCEWSVSGFTNPFLSTWVRPFRVWRECIPTLYKQLTTLSSKQNRHMVRSKASQHLQCSPPATSLFQSTDGTASKNFTATNTRGPSTPAASWPNLVATRKPTLLTLQLNSCCNVMSFIIPRSCTWGRWVWHFSTSSSESSHLSCARIKTEIE